MPGHPIIMLLLLAFATSANAVGDEYGYHISLAPNPATTSDVISVTIEAFTTQCTRLREQIGTDDLGDGIIRFRLDGSDACESVPPHTRTYMIGPLTAGDYTFQFAFCGINTPSGEICTPAFASLPVRVRGPSGKRFTVPAHSRRATLVLALLCVLLGLLAKRRN